MHITVECWTVNQKCKPTNYLIFSRFKCGCFVIIDGKCAMLCGKRRYPLRKLLESIKPLQNYNCDIWFMSIKAALWQKLFCIVTKPLDLQWTTKHHWKDIGHIFHLASWDLKSIHPLGHSCLVKIMGPSCLFGKLSDTSISSSLSLPHDINKLQ